MLLTEQEIDDISREMVKGCKSVNWLAKKKSNLRCLRN